jgi:hypothetical protein
MRATTFLSLVAAVFIAGPPSAEDVLAPEPIAPRLDAIESQAWADELVRQAADEARQRFGEVRAELPEYAKRPLEDVAADHLDRLTADAAEYLSVGHRQAVAAHRLFGLGATLSAMRDVRWPTPAEKEAIDARYVQVRDALQTLLLNRSDAIRHEARDELAKSLDHQFEQWQTDVRLASFTYLLSKEDEQELLKLTERAIGHLEDYFGQAGLKKYTGSDWQFVNDVVNDFRQDLDHAMTPRALASRFEGTDAQMAWHEAHVEQLEALERVSTTRRMPCRLPRGNGLGPNVRRPVILPGWPNTGTASVKRYFGRWDRVRSRGRRPRALVEIARLIPPRPRKGRR